MKALLNVRFIHMSKSAGFMFKLTKNTQSNSEKIKYGTD